MPSKRRKGNYVEIMMIASLPRFEKTFHELEDVSYGTWLSSLDSGAPIISSQPFKAWI